MIRIFYHGVFLTPLGMLIIGMIWSVFFLSALAEIQAAVVQSIKITGNKRVDARTIREHLSIQPGNHFSDLDIDESVKLLAALGLFSDVRINLSSDVLVVEVAEYDIVNRIIFHGNKKLKDADLGRALILKPLEAFSKARLELDEQTIQDAYTHLGQKGVGITSKIVNQGDGRVDVIFQISEGKRPRISKISFHGNKVFSHRQLVNTISTKKSHIFSWLNGRDIYSEDRLAADEVALRRFYQSRGYADFRVLRTDTHFDSVKNEYAITFFIEEGMRYRFEDIHIESTIAGLNIRQVSSVLKTQRGNIYNILKIEESITALNKKVGDLGYAFAQIETLEDRNFSKKTISLIYAIDEGARAYIERIDIRGNTRTRDHVIRRELDLGEGDAFNHTAITQAKRRLEELDFFQKVNISTSPGSKSDRIVLTFDVIEKPTGEFLMGGGYTTGGETPGFVGNFSVSDSNFLGYGQYLHLGVDIGEHSARSYNVSFTEPYFWEYKLSSGFGIFRRIHRMSSDYNVHQAGGALHFALPVTDNFAASVNYNYTKEKYAIDDYQCQGDNACREDREDYSDAIIEAMENGPWRRSSVGYALTYNSLDRFYDPHEGLYIRWEQEYAGLGGDARFLKTIGRAILYDTLSESYDTVGLFGIGGGYIQEVNSGGTRLFDLFRNNTEIIRGFKFNGIGPMEKSSKGKQFFLGGTTYMHATIELQFPVPVSAAPESLGIRSALFADTATLYGNNYQLKGGSDSEIINIKSAFRSSIGMSLMWSSPFGPLRFDYAIPVMKQEGDIVQRINFGISTRF